MSKRQASLLSFCTSHKKQRQESEEKADVQKSQGSKDLLTEESQVESEVVSG